MIFKNCSKPSSVKVYLVFLFLFNNYKFTTLSSNVNKVQIFIINIIYLFVSSTGTSPYIKWLIR